MKVIPFSLLPLNRLNKGASLFRGLSKKLGKRLKGLNTDLSQARIEFNAEEYLALCLFASLIFFIFISAILFVFLGLLQKEAKLSFSPPLAALSIASGLTFFVILQQLNYPKLVKMRRIKSLESNLLFGLRNIMIQVNAGVPFFNVMLSIGNGNYGELSLEFGRAVKEISSGKNQVDALKDLTENNPSPFFRRAMWQLVNGMKAGSDISDVLREVIRTVSEEQFIQISEYGAQLNPIALFYMLLTVIVPSLSVTFMIILSAFLGFSGGIVKLLFWSLYGVVLFMQFFFIGIISAKRPSLMGE